MRQSWNVSFKKLYPVFFIIIFFKFVWFSLLICIHALNVTDFFFTLSEISINVRHPPTKISIIPEEMVKPEWGLPEVKYRFITR